MPLHFIVEQNSTEKSSKSALVPGIFLSLHLYLCEITYDPCSPPSAAVNYITVLYFVCSIWKSDTFSQMACNQTEVKLGLHGKDLVVGKLQGWLP